MKLTTTAVGTLALAGYAQAHTRVWSVWVNGEDQGDGRDGYVRSPPDNNPVKDLSSSDIVCNVKGGTPVPKFVTAAPGDDLEIEWYHNSRGDDIIDGSHKGPVQAWIAPYTEGNGADAIWTKIASKGYDAESGKWAVDDLIAARGKAPVTLPSALAPGKYLLRSEIIGLHEGDSAYKDNPARGSQFYPSCIQLEVTGNGSAKPPQDFDFGTGYTYSDEGIVFNLYGCNGACDYTAPGPAVWNAKGNTDNNGDTDGNDNQDGGNCH